MLVQACIYREREAGEQFATPLGIGMIEIDPIFDRVDQHGEYISFDWDGGTYMGAAEFDSDPGLAPGTEVRHVFLDPPNCGGGYNAFV